MFAELLFKLLEFYFASGKSIVFLAFKYLFFCLYGWIYKNRNNLSRIEYKIRNISSIWNFCRLLETRKFFSINKIMRNSGKECNSNKNILIRNIFISALMRINNFNMYIYIYAVATYSKYNKSLNFKHFLTVVRKS